MAVRYAVATGNWSDTATWNGGTLPTSADDVYANSFTVTVNQDVTVLSMQTTAQSPAIAGGGFILSTSNTINCTGAGIIPGTTTCLTFNGASGVNAIVNSLIRNSASTNNTNGILKSGIGTLNINGNLQYTTSGTARYMLLITASGITNIVGNLLPWFQAPCIQISGGTNPIINITGNINPNKGTGSSEQAIVTSVICTINVTGNLYGGGGNGSCINIGSTASFVYVTGSVFGGSSGGYGINATGPCYINVVGPLNAKHTDSIETFAVLSSSANAINLLSGPFICGPNGTMPFSLIRMNYIITPGSYFEFRDSSTNGAISPPSAPAAATRLVSPDTIVDSPVPTNVRSGINYALGSLTGTLAVPSPNSVALGVPTDNTTGSAVLTPSAIWNYATSNITDADTIGARLKNASTVDTTGAQLTAFL